jgi:hypothetical protein
MKDNTWTDNKTCGLNGPISKGQHTIILHAGRKKGFKPNALDFQVKFQK